MTRSPNNSRFASPVGDVISDQNNSLSHLCKHAKQLDAITALLHRHVTPDLPKHFQVAAMRQDRLILITPSATWATRLRMQSSKMLVALKSSAWSQLLHIDIRIAPLNLEPESNPVRRQLSPAAKLAFSMMSQLSDDTSTESDR